MKTAVRLAVAAACIIAAMVIIANAEDRGAWFKSLRQPLTGASCCDISDCQRTEAEPKTIIHPDGVKTTQWWAEVQGEWMPIPNEKILDKTSIDGDAYVCSGFGRRIYCFVPPTMAM